MVNDYVKLFRLLSPFHATMLWGLHQKRALPRSLEPGHKYNKLYQKKEYGHHIALFSALIFLFSLAFLHWLYRTNRPSSKYNTALLKSPSWSWSSFFWTVSTRDSRWLINLTIAAILLISDVCTCQYIFGLHTRMLIQRSVGTWLLLSRTPWAWLKRKGLLAISLLMQLSSVKEIIANLSSYLLIFSFRLMGPTTSLA